MRRFYITVITITKPGDINQIKALYLIQMLTGIFIIHPRKDHYDNFKLDITYGNDRFIDFDASYLYDYSSYSKNEWHRISYFFTDRAIYRPGQTVYFKGILLRTNGDKSFLDTNASTNVILYDVNYQQVASLNLVADAYGSVSGTFVLPVGVLNGTMRITDGYGTKYVQVEDYKRPKFYVNLDTVKGNYRLGETINMKGVAKGYNGASIDGATVKYRVERQENMPWWYSYYYGRYNRSGSSNAEIANGTVTSNDTGGFAFNFFKAIPDLNESKSYNPTFNFSLYVDVTDANGETHNTETLLLQVGYTSLTLDIQIPQTVDKTATDTFNIESLNMQRSKVPASGNIVIYKLKEPSTIYRSGLWSVADTFIYNKQQWDTVFPGDPYQTEDEIVNYPKGEKVLEQSFNTGEKRICIFANLSAWPQGSYVMEAHTQDAYGQDVKDMKYFTVFSPVEKNNPTNTPDWFSAIKKYCEPGENAKFLIGSAYVIVTVMYEIEKKNKIISHEWFTLNHEQRVIEIPVSDSDRGGFGVHFVFVKNNRLYLHDDNVSVDWSNKDLSLKFESFRNKLLPGQKEEWKIKVRDGKGQKANAQMMATLYDASLDEFAANSFYLSVYPYYYASMSWSDPRIFSSYDSWSCSKDWNTNIYLVGHSYDQLIPQGYYYTANANSYAYSWGYENGRGDRELMTTKAEDEKDVDKTVAIVTSSGATTGASPGPTKKTGLYDSPDIAGQEQQMGSTELKKV